MKIRLEDLSQFALSMAQCLEAGLVPTKALTTSGRTTRSGPFRSAIQAAAELCARGIPISDALEPSARLFPQFALPVLRAGEMGGRQVEAFRLIYEHCERLKPTLKVVRSTWLYPLICVVSGWSLRTAIFLYFGFYSFAWQFVKDTYLTSAVVVLGCWALLRVGLVKRAIDWALLYLPVVGKVQVRLATVLFFATFRLVYEAGGLGVIAMFDLALRTVSNSAVRDDFLSARDILGENGAFEDAFSAPQLIEDRLKSSIAAGALSGHLGTSLGQIVKQETVELEFTLDLFNRVFQRLVAFSVSISIAGTLYLCLTYTAK